MTTKPYWARVCPPLAGYADGFRAELERLGHTPLTTAAHVRLMAHLSRWMAVEALTVSGLTPPVVDRYFAERRAAGYYNERTPRALAPLVGYLQRLGAIPIVPSAVAATPVDELLAEYRHYLSTERGLAKPTIDLNVRLVRPFLIERVNASRDGLGLKDLTAGEVAGFVVTLARQRPRSVKRIVTALRSFLGFLYVTGVIGQPLAVPAAAGWSLAGLPKALEDDQITALLATCDAGTVTGRRDFAILTLLVRLGLRAGEVAGLLLEDIDWRAGVITVRGKGNRHHRLPLPADVGERIVAY
jgi:site-specific recombinase XerD